MQQLTKYLIIFWLVVITDPYKNLDYDKINVYEFKKEYRTLGMSVTEPEDSPQDYEDQYEQETQEKQESVEPYFCSFCSPPGWIFN